VISILPYDIGLLLERSITPKYLVGLMIEKPTVAEGVKEKTPWSMNFIAPRDREIY